MPVMTNVIEIVMQGQATSTSGGLKNIWNVFHYRLSAGTMDPITQILSQFETQVFSFVIANLSASYTLVAMLGRVMDDVTNQYIGLGESVVGGKVGAKLPNLCAVVMPMKGAQRGKNYRGSKHFGPIPEADQVGDELSPTAAAAWQTVVPKIQNPFTFTTQTYQPIILSRSLSQLKVNPPSLIGSDLYTVLLNKTIGSMRKRKEKTAR
jgi:hypothetical protein